MPAGHAGQFEPIIDAHWATILKLALQMTGDQNEAEEIAQQTFYLAYRAWPTFEQRSTVLTWLFRIAVNACKQHMIKRRRENTVPLDEAPPSFTHDHDPIESRELRERLDAAMQAISPKHRMVLTLICLDELDHEAVAEILGCPIGTVWSRLYNARAALARQLEQETER
jgi:RNA polymerase sigma-70 factor (ECF subfamily)